MREKDSSYKYEFSFNKLIPFMNVDVKEWGSHGLMLKNGCVNVT
jgi:hypothetical protein